MRINEKEFLESLPSEKHGFRYSRKGYCTICGQQGPVVYRDDTVGRHYFALCSDCCQVVLAIHESKDL